MPALAIEVSPVIEREYFALSDAQRQQLNFEMVFRLGQFSKRSESGGGLKRVFRAARAEASRNGVTIKKMNEALDQTGHGD